MYEYERDGAEIYRQSFATIRAEADLARFPADVAQVVVRMIHACGQVDLVDDVAFSPAVVDRARAALDAGAPVLCDAQMVASGITRRRLPKDNDVVCTLNDPRTPGLAAELGTTRTAAALDLWADRLDGAVVAIGNAPTALFHLLETVVTTLGDLDPETVDMRCLVLVGSSQTRVGPSGTVWTPRTYPRCGPRCGLPASAPARDAGPPHTRAQGRCEMSEPSQQTRTGRLLTAVIDGGGTLAAGMGLAAELVRRGRAVTVLPDPTVEPCARAAGCDFTAWQTAPHFDSIDDQTAMVGLFETGKPYRQFTAVRDRLLFGPAPLFADEVLAAGTGTRRTPSSRRVRYRGS